MTRETFASRAGIVLTMIGVAIGLGNVWRFPYLVGRYGGAAFVLVYVVIAFAIGIPGLMAEWALGRRTRRGTVGAFARAGVWRGHVLGWALFGVVVAATAYYTNVVGWVLYFAIGEIARAAGGSLQPAAILPPADGFQGTSFALQVACTAAVTVASGWVLVRGMRRGVERVSVVIIPALFAILLILIARSLTLPGAWAGVSWYIGGFRWADLTPTVVVAAMGHAIFSMSLGGTFMVTYGSYLPEKTDLAPGAVATAVGDTLGGLLAGFAIFPAVFALGLEPGSGPGLLFDTLPRVFERMPGGAVFGFLFFIALMGAAYLSAVAAFEVLVAALVDNLGVSRRRAVWTMCAVVGLVALIPMINLRIFVPWDLTFGSGMQTLGALLAVLSAGWALDRAALLEELSREDGRSRTGLVLWIRYVVPAGIVSVGLWWLLTDVLRVIERV